jgi:hypothetical protein
MLNEEGQLVIPPEFIGIEEFSQNGLAHASQFVDDVLLYGFIDKSGQRAIQPQFSYAGRFSANGLALVKVERKENLWGYIDRDNR